MHELQTVTRPLWYATGSAWGTVATSYRFESGEYFLHSFCGVPMKRPENTYGMLWVECERRNDIWSVYGHTGGELDI